MGWTKDQEKAIYESGQNIIVSAGAGSGKTAVLSERILEKVKSGVSIDSLLVLTFTEAAAFEMKERIKKKVKDNPSTTHLASDVDSAYITTFDSYALSIVKKYHYLLGIDKNISVIDNSIIELFKINTLNSIFESLYEEKDALFLEFINKYCLKNDNQLKKEILNIDKKLDLKLNKEKFIYNYKNLYLNDKFYNSIYSDFEDYTFNLVNLSKLYYDEYIDVLEDKVYEKVVDYYSDYFECYSLDDLRLFFSKRALILKNLDEEAKVKKEQFTAVLDEIKNCVNNYPSKDNFIRDLKNSEYYVNILLDILIKLNKEVNKYKFDNLSFEFSDIAKMSIKCLKENPNELNKLKYSLNEILLDEYQDTNDLQEEFISLISNNNVYMVGDIKQSIYRFRNANPSIFMNKYESYKDNKGGMKIDLIKNFRSRQEVVDSINLIFSPLMSLARGGADYRKDHIMHFGNTNYNIGGKVDSQSFKIEFPYYNIEKEDLKQNKNLNIETFFMAKDILNKVKSNYLIMDKNTNLARPIKYKDISILVDKSNNFDLITRVFNYFGIPTEIVKNDNLASNSLIYTFSSILNLISLVKEKIFDEDFKLSYLSVARSFIYCMSDDELTNLVLDNDFYSTSLYESIVKLSNNLEIKSNYSLIEEIIDEFDIINKLSLIGDIEQNLMRIEYIYSLASNYSSLGFNSVAFINKLKEVLDSEFKIEIKGFDGGSDSVKIMTIHKSKGLEYPLVYLPFLTSTFFNSDSKSSFIYSSSYQIITPLNSDDDSKSISKFLDLRKEKEETLSEKIRLFYVALTRARDKLIIIRQNASEDNNLDDFHLSKCMSINDLLNSIGFTLSNYSYEIDVDSLNISNDYIYFKEKKKELDESKVEIKHILNKNESKEIDRVHSSKETHDLLDYDTVKNMNFGTYMHEIMESIDLVNPNYEGIENWMIPHIKYFLSLDILKDINNARIFKEYEFSFVSDKKYHGIIDLLIEYEDRILIIDYKLNDIENLEYIKQLSSYKEYIKSLNLNKDIHMYLFSFLEDKIKEI